MEGGAIDQRRQDAEARDRMTRALTYRFGGDCWKELECAFDHSQVEKQIFVDERELRVRKLMVRRGFCVRGKCKFQGCYARSLRVAVVVSDAADSDYESADSNDCTDDCTGDGSASESGSSGEKWESGSEGVLREGSEEEWRADRRPSRREAIRENIYNCELQQSGGRYEALINDSGPDDGLLRPKAEGGAELEVDKPGFAFACMRIRIRPQEHL